MGNKNRAERRKPLQEAYRLAHSREPNNVLQPPPTKAPDSPLSPRPVPPTPTGEPFYESNLFWGAIGLFFGIVLTVIAAMQKDLRWLLIVAWPFGCIAVFACARAISSGATRWILVIVGCFLIGGGLWELHTILKPSSESIAKVPEHPTVQDPPKPPPPEPKVPQIRAFDLSGTRGAEFLRLLSPPPKDSDTLRIGCLSWSENSCIAAGKFLIVFSEAGWKIDSNKVFRMETTIPVDGINLDAHIDKAYTDNLPPHMGHRAKMNTSQIKIMAAFNQEHVPVHESTGTDVPKGTLGVYFSLEPTVTEPERLAEPPKNSKPSEPAHGIKATPEAKTLNLTMTETVPSGDPLSTYFTVTNNEDFDIGPHKIECDINSATSPTGIMDRMKGHDFEFPGSLLAHDAESAQCLRVLPHFSWQCIDLIVIFSYQMHEETQYRQFRRLGRPSGGGYIWVPERLNDPRSCIDPAEINKK